jgi:hypothetical protein
MCDDKKISLTILAENITSSRAFIKNIHTKKRNMQWIWQGLPCVWAINGKIKCGNRKFT